MGFGLGLGSFVDGFARGVGIRGQMDERAEAKKDRQYARDRAKVEDTREDALYTEQAGDRAYARGRMKVTDARTDTAYARDEAERVALDTINADTKTAFDQEVEAGTQDPDAFGEFWTKYALPKRERELLAQGDTEGAKALREWGQSEDALKGGRLFASAMLKAQTGDPAGALQDAIAAGQVGGYISHGYEVAGQKEMRDADGNLLGYRLSIAGPDGKSFDQDIAVGDVGKVISTFLNPDAAWTSQQQAKSKASEDANKTATELSTYEAKKRIDAKYDRAGGPSAKDRADAIKNLRTRFDGGLSGKDASFDDMPTAQQEELIQKELALLSGTSSAPAPPQPQTVVDTLTGKPVVPGLAPDPKSGRTGPAAAPGISAPGSSIVPRGTQQAPAPVAPTPDRLPATAPSALPASAADERGRLIEEAATMIAQGSGDISGMVERLKAAGVPQDQWPMKLNIYAKAGLRP